MSENYREGKQPKDIRLENDQLNTEAGRLIDQAKDILRHSPAFLAALVSTFFGKSDFSFSTTQLKAVDFTIRDGLICSVRYGETEKETQLRIAKWKISQSGERGEIDSTSGWEDVIIRKTQGRQKEIGDPGAIVFVQSDADDIPNNTLSTVKTVENFLEILKQDLMKI